MRQMGIILLRENIRQMRLDLYHELERGACHLWWWRTVSSLDEPLARRGAGFLSAGELERYRRYLVPGAARTFLASRVFLRSILSAYSECAPPEWRFEANAWGRPYIANAGAPPGLCFNLSHKPGFTACLVGAGRELGVDVEDSSGGRAHLLELAGRFFSPSESAALQELSAAHRMQRFYELWTLKEAYIKARGMGLSLGLARFSFSVAGETATVRFDPGFDDDPAAWQFRLFRACAPHLISTAVRLDARPLRIDVRDAAGTVTRALE
jgi:4'-phosphopantetheinyl transferase